MITYSSKRSARELAEGMLDQLEHKSSRNEKIVSALQKIAEAAQLFDELGHPKIAELLTAQLENTLQKKAESLYNQKQGVPYLNTQYNPIGVSDEDGIPDGKCAYRNVSQKGTTRSIYYLNLEKRDGKEVYVWYLIVQYGMEPQQNKVARRGDRYQDPADTACAKAVENTHTPRLDKGLPSAYVSNIEEVTGDQVNKKDFIGWAVGDGNVDFAIYRVNGKLFKTRGMKDNFNMVRGPCTKRK